MWSLHSLFNWPFEIPVSLGFVCCFFCLFVLFFSYWQLLTAFAGSSQDSVLRHITFTTCSHYLCVLTQWHVFSTVNKNQQQQKTWYPDWLLKFLTFPRTQEYISSSLIGIATWVYSGTEFLFIFVSSAFFLFQYGSNLFSKLLKSKTFK